MKFDATGQMTVFASGISNPQGLAFDDNGNLYVSADVEIIYKYDPTGGVSVFASGGSLHGPRGLAFDVFEFLFVVSASGGQIIKYSPTGQSIYVGGPPGTSPSMFGAAFSPSGYLFVSITNGNGVWKFTTTGFATPFSCCELFAPTGLAFDNSENLYVANLQNRTIQKFDADGQGTLFAETSGDPYGIAFDTSGNLYVTEANNNTIEKFNPAGQASFFAFGMGSPSGIAIQPCAFPTPAPSILGNIAYCSTLNPVPNVTLNLNGNGTASTTTDASGHYQFSTPMAGGSYDVRPSKDDLTSGSAGINTVDVIAVQRHFLNLGTPLSGCRLTAANVTFDSVINTVDVIAIQRFFLGFGGGQTKTGMYQFDPVNRVYGGIVSQQTDQNYEALIFGDVASPFVD